MPEDLGTICGTSDVNQVIYVYDEYRNTLPYNPDKYPTIKIS